MVELANDGVVDIFRILILETTKVIPNINMPLSTILSNLMNRHLFKVKIKETRGL